MMLRVFLFLVFMMQSSLSPMVASHVSYMKQKSEKSSTPIKQTKSDVCDEEEDDSIEKQQMEFDQTKLLRFENHGIDIASSPRLHVLEQITCSLKKSILIWIQNFRI
jgi:hypothetical protein